MKGENVCIFIVNKFLGMTLVLLFIAIIWVSYLVDYFVGNNLDVCTNNILPKAQRYDFYNHKKRNAK